MSVDPLIFIRNQIALADYELRAYPPKDIDWAVRADRAAERLIPWLQTIAAPMSAHVTGVMNSPNDVRSATDYLIARLRTHPKLSKESATKNQIALLRSSLDLEQLLISGAGGAVVSKLIEGYLIQKSVDWVLESNGSSDYPDLYFRSNDHAGLPVFKRGSKLVYGAALKGKAGRPVRIPDGLEIKTCRKNFAVDCHHAHLGLHLVLVFESVKRRFVVKGVHVGFMRHSLYRITVPATPTTTLKASFNGEHFISLFVAEQPAANM